MKYAWRYEPERWRLSAPDKLVLHRQTDTQSDSLVSLSEPKRKVFKCSEGHNSTLVGAMIVDSPKKYILWINWKEGRGTREGASSLLYNIWLFLGASISLISEVDSLELSLTLTKEVSRTEHEHAPVIGDHFGVVTDSRNPGWCSCPRVDDIRVWVVVDPFIVTLSVVGQNTPYTCRCCPCRYEMTVSRGITRSVIIGILFWIVITSKVVSNLVAEAEVSSSTGLFSHREGVAIFEGVSICSPTLPG